MRVLILSHEAIGPRMAGPAIRCWELARVLGQHFRVRLAAPGIAASPHPAVEPLPYPSFDSTGLEPVEKAASEWADVVVGSGYTALAAAFLKDLPVPWVADVYIPAPVESLAWHRASDPESQWQAHVHTWRATRAAAMHADFFVCANERQRDFWLGILAASGRLQPDGYALDPTFRQLVDVVPFGCPAESPQPEPVLRGKWPGIGLDDRVILWGGGIWNWVDPVTLLHAMVKVVARHPNARLVFLGANHPEPARVPEMECARQARATSQELGLEGSAVFWGDWVPYDQRGSYLLEADVGVSLHRPGVEARLAFRTRLLDAIWAGLPMVTTREDSLSAELESSGVAYTVEPGATDAVAAAICTLLDEPSTSSVQERAYSSLRAKYSWEAVTKPLVRFCQEPRTDPGKPAARDLTSGPILAEESALRAEVSRLEELVGGYESGRLMRAMLALHRLRHRFVRS